MSELHDAGHEDPKQLDAFDPGSAVTQTGVRFFSSDFQAVPAHLKPKKCRGCPAKIYMIRTESAWAPIDCDVPGGKRPVRTEPGRGISHFMSCPAAKEFRRSR